mmetsp:Transcript_54559/g.115910  ORF Transcript_54559/g.115910 Transcript_54559/m.115910 type:complete len:207 (-) Transcript_54559:433-1053(-)
MPRGTSCSVPEPSRPRRRRPSPREESARARATAPATPQLRGNAYELRLLRLSFGVFGIDGGRGCPGVFVETIVARAENGDDANFEVLVGDVQFRPGRRVVVRLLCCGRQRFQLHRQSGRRPCRLFDDERVLLLRRGDHLRPRRVGRSGQLDVQEGGEQPERATRRRERRTGGRRRPEAGRKPEHTGGPGALRVEAQLVRGRGRGEA